VGKNISATRSGLFSSKKTDLRAHKISSWGQTVDGTEKLEAV
jgi:hypothetical protein